MLSPSVHHTTSFVTNNQSTELHHHAGCYTAHWLIYWNTAPKYGKNVHNTKVSCEALHHSRIQHLLRQDFTTFGALELPAAVPASLPLPSTSVNGRLLLLAFSLHVLGAPWKVVGDRRLAGAAEEHKASALLWI